MITGAVSGTFGAVTGEYVPTYGAGSVTVRRAGSGDPKSAALAPDVPPGAATGGITDAVGIGAAWPGRAGADRRARPTVARRPWLAAAPLSRAAAARRAVARELAAARRAAARGR